MPKDARGSSTHSSAASWFLTPVRVKLQHKTLSRVPSAPSPCRLGHTTPPPPPHPCCVAVHRLPLAGESPGGCSTLGRSAGASWVLATDPGEEALCPSTKPPRHRCRLPAVPVAEPLQPGALPQAADGSWGQSPAAQTRIREQPASTFSQTFKQLNSPQVTHGSLVLFTPCLNLPLKLQVFIFPSLAVALRSAAEDRLHPRCQFDLRFTAQAPKSSAACEVLRENHSRKCLFPS